MTDARTQAQALAAWALKNPEHANVRTMAAFADGYDAGRAAAVAEARTLLREAAVELGIAAAPDECCTGDCNQGRDCPRQGARDE